MEVIGGDDGDVGGGGVGGIDGGDGDGPPPLSMDPLVRILKVLLYTRETSQNILIVCIL